MAALEIRYYIESRWPKWARWRKMTARPHGEHYPFEPDTHNLVFQNWDAAEQAAESFSRHNAGQYRVVGTDKEEQR